MLLWPRGTPRAPLKPFLSVSYVIMFYVISSFLPSLPGRRRDADPGIKSPPDYRTLSIAGPGAHRAVWSFFMESETKLITTDPLTLPGGSDGHHT